MGDACDLTGEVREMLYDAESPYSKNGYAQAIVRSEGFANITSGVILINALWIGVDTDHNNATDPSEVELPFKIADQFFAIFFTFELLVRFVAFRNKRDSLKDH